MTTNIVNLKAARVARQVAALLGRKLQTSPNNIPWRVYSFTLFYDRPALSSDAVSDVSSLLRDDLDKLHQAIAQTFGPNWQEVSNLVPMDRIVPLDDGTYIVPTVLVILPELDPWQGDDFALEKMVTGIRGLNACYLSEDVSTIEVDLSRFLRGPSYDVNLLKGLARDAGSVFDL